MSDEVTVDIDRHLDALFGGAEDDLGTPRSEAYFAAAQRLIPGGVNSPVRAFRGVGGTPLFMTHGAGARIHDADGYDYIDYVLSWGPLAAGHAHEEVVAAVQEAAERGLSFGAPTQSESELAALLIARVPSLEMVRFVNSGTEATMTALRLARAFTGRPKIVKMAGCYHGHADALLVQAGSGVATLGLPDSPGVTPGAAADTLTVPYGDIDALAGLLAERGEEIAAVILEPVAGNMGLVVPPEGYLAGVAEACQAAGALLIFDEVMTGFRVSPGGAQERFGVTPDLTCLGKVIGGGLPVGAFGGRTEIMARLAPAGPVYQAGTLSGNPLAMAAGLATLRVLLRPGAFEAAEAMCADLAAGIAEEAREASVPVQVSQIGTMFGVYLLKEDGAPPITDYATALAHADPTRYGRFFHAMLACGVYLAPSQFEAGFLSTAHAAHHIEQTLEAASEAFAAIAA